MDWSPISISLATAFTATLLTAVAGLAAAAWRESRGGPVIALVDGFFLLPLVLPPTVVGFFLLLLFGRNGPIGRLLLHFGATVVFSWPATVIAAAVVAFPLMYLTSRAALEQVDPPVLQAARTLGASEWRVFSEISLPLAWPGILAGVILSFARALGEFGATLMIAGDIPGRTATIPIAIYFAVEADEIRTALAWCAVDVVISLVLIGLLYHWTNTRGFARRSAYGAARRKSARDFAHKRVRESHRGSGAPGSASGGGAGDPAQRSTEPEPAEQARR